jgi:HEAT repeat protein
MSQITGREPRLFLTDSKQRLLPRRLASLLSTLNPNAVSLEAVRAALNSDDFFVRYNAGLLIVRRPDRTIRLLCEQVLRHDPPLARAAVARILHAFSWFSAEPLIRLALSDVDTRVHEAAVYALADSKHLNAYRLMAEILPGAPDNVLEAAAIGLRDCQDAAVVPALKVVLTARDSDVRVKGLEALAATETPQALAVVQGALADFSPAVRYAACLSLLELAHADGLPVLAQLIRDEPGVMRLYMLHGLFHASNYLNLKLDMDVLFNALALALADELPETRVAAVRQLAWLRDPRGDHLLSQAYQQESNPKAKIEMLRIAVRLMSGVGDAMLEAALADDHIAVRQAAESIVAHRAETGIVLSYDESADSGTGLNHPHLGR